MLMNQFAKNMPLPNERRIETFESVGPNTATNASLSAPTGSARESGSSAGDLTRPMSCPTQRVCSQASADAMSAKKTRTLMRFLPDFQDT